MHGGVGGGNREATPYPDPLLRAIEGVDGRVKPGQSEVSRLTSAG